VAPAVTAVAELTDQVRTMTAVITRVDPASLTVADQRALSVLLNELTALLRLAATS
jgi:hypothetical protein